MLLPNWEISVTRNLVLARLKFSKEIRYTRLWGINATIERNKHQRKGSHIDFIINWIDLSLTHSSSIKMSLEQYQQLAKQEQDEIPKSLIPKVIHNLKLLGHFLFNSKHTELETLLINDESTFASDLTQTYGFTQHYEQYGEIFSLKIPHPLRTQLNNSAISKEVVNELESKINEIPVIVFIHGLGGNLQQFDEVVRKFAGLTDIFAVDLPGSGKSKAKQGLKLSLENFTNFVKESLDTNGFIGREIIIVGHSYGTQVALKLAEANEINLKGLVLLAPPKIPLKRTWKENFFLGLFLKIPWLFEFFRKLDRFNNIQSLSMKRLFSNPETPEFLRLKQFRFNLLTNSTNFLNHAKSWIPLTISEVIDASQTISNNNGSILIVDGSDDKVTHDGGASYHDLLGNNISQYQILENAGHNFILESFETLNPLLEKFFVSLDSRLDSDYPNKLRSEFSKRSIA